MSSENLRYVYTINVSAIPLMNDFMDILYGELMSTIKHDFADEVTILLADNKLTLQIIVIAKSIKSATIIESIAHDYFLPYFLGSNFIKYEVTSMRVVYDYDPEKMILN